MADNYAILAFGDTHYATPINSRTLPHITWLQSLEEVELNVAETDWQYKASPTTLAETYQVVSAIEAAPA